MTGVSDEMVERAALASINACRARWQLAPVANMDNISETHKRQTMEDARAALAAVMPDVVAAERESCAVIAEGHNKLGMYSTIIADAIRARGDAIAEPPADG